MTAIAGGILRIAPLKPEAGLLITALVEVMQQVGRRIRRQRSGQLGQSLHKGQHTFPLPGRTPGRRILQADQRLQDLRFQCCHVTQKVLPSSPRGQITSRGLGRADVLKTRVTPIAAGGILLASMSLLPLQRLSGMVATLTSAVLLTTLVNRPIEAASIAVKEGQKIGFMGDSITQAGAEPEGYVTLVIRGLEANGIRATAVPAGISGHKSNQMLERLDRDVLSKKPDWMTLSCGVNDVWHGANGIPLDAYKKNITEIVEKSQAAGVKVMILTSTMIGEDAPNSNNQKLATYNDFLRDLAKKKRCRLADLNADMQAAITKAGPDHKGNLLTSDGVHMNPEGNRMMATGVLKAFGLSAKQLKKAQDSWSKPATATAH